MNENVFVNFLYIYITTGEINVSPIIKMNFRECNKLFMEQTPLVVHRGQQCEWLSIAWTRVEKLSAIFNEVEQFISVPTDMCTHSKAHSQNRLFAKCFTPILFA